MIPLPRMMVRLVSSMGVYLRLSLFLQLYFYFQMTLEFKFNSNCIFILKSFYFLVRGSKNPLDSKSDSLKEHPKSGDESIMRVEMLYGLETFYNYIFFSNTFTFKLNSNCIFIFQILLLSN